MNTKKLSKSTRKFIRVEKARIRRKVLDLKEQEKLIKELYQKFHQAQIRLIRQKEYNNRSEDPSILEELPSGSSKAG